MTYPEQVQLREARSDDVARIHALILALAEYEKLTHAVDARESDLRAALFGERPRAFCDVADAGDGSLLGFALWFYSYSTFRGRHGIYLEDLFVVPQARGRGIGRALLANLARRCTREGLARLEWSVLDWNAPSIAFYRALGAQPLDEWTMFRLTGPELARLGADDASAAKGRGADGRGSGA